jgi:hypothetical protein
MDNIDGNLTSSIASFGVGAVNMAVETTPESPYLITYAVSDVAGNAATVSGALVSMLPQA